LWKRIGYLGNADLNYLRTKDGYEIDYIIRMKDGTVIPIEVKWTDSPNAHDAKNIEKFIAENKNKCSCGFIICRVSRAMKINKNTTALPWKEM
jgi:predicted AAA+ superfamily ATPase